MPQYTITDRDEVRTATIDDERAPRVVVEVHGQDDAVFLGARHTIDGGVLKIFAHGRRGVRPAIEYSPSGWISVSVYDYIKPEPGRVMTIR